MEIQPGTVVLITHDITVSGLVAFKKGEQVTVEQIAENNQRPEYKYVIHSKEMGKRFQLSDNDILLLPSQESESKPGQVVQPRVARAPVYPATKPEKSNRPLIIGIIIAGVVVAIFLLGHFLITIPLMNSARETARRRTCQANLRTIDGAITAYVADTGKNPNSVEALVQAHYLMKLHTCPSGPKPYRLVGEGKAQEAICPNDSSHTL